MGSPGRGRSPRIPVRICILLCVIAAATLPVSAQSPAGFPIIVQHYAAAERIPNSITDFIFDSRGILWITPNNDNIRMFDGTNVRVMETPFARGIPQFEFSRVLKDSNGNPCFLSLDHENFFRLNKAGQLSEDSLTGEARHEAIRRMGGDNKTVVPFGDSIKLTGAILDDSLFRAKQGRPTMQLFRSEYPHLLCGTRLYRIESGNDTILSTVFVGDLSFIDRPISKIAYEPVNKVTAVATMGEGLYILKPNPFYARRFDDAFLKLKRKMIYFPITLLARDTFLTPWGKFTGTGSYRVLDPAHEGPRGLLADEAGNVWEGSKKRIVRYDRNMVKQWETAVPLPSTVAIDFCEVAPGELYCLTDKSILRYEGGTFVDRRPMTDRPPGDIRFQQMRDLGKGIFWVTANKGVYRYDQHTNRLDRIAGVPDVFTLNIAKLSGGAVLITCYPESYYYLYYKDRFFKIPVEADLPLKETSSLLEDGKGRIWFATTSGFFVTTEKEIEAWCDGKTRSIYYYRYGRNEGLQDLEFNGGLNRSNALSADGYLAFNSMGGVTVFQQDSVKELFPAGPILIGKRGTLGEEYAAGDSVSLPHDNEGMIVQVRVPYFGSRDNLRIEYCLAPEQEGWKEVDPQVRISLGHLVHGNYVLSARVRTGLLPDDYRTRRVVVTVPYLFYETPGFRLVAAAILLLVCLLVTVAIIRLRREVRMKNARLHDQNLQLQSTLVHLQENMALKEKLISLVLHDLKTPLYFQSLLFNQIMQKDYFKSEEAYQLFHDLRNSSTAILQFTKEFLAWYSSQREGFQVRNTEFDHKAVVDDLFSVYADIAERKELQLQYRNQGVDRLYTDRKILEIIIRNLLDNAIKYTGQGQVSIAFERQDGADSIMVSDTGSGMSAEKIRQLERYADASAKQTSPTFGYRFIYTMSEKIGASIRIVSTPGTGSCVTIVLKRVKVFANATGG